ncbi:MAG: hypothetical protein ACK4SA_07870, partial [Caldilinea sp.]
MQRQKLFNFLLLTALLAALITPARAHAVPTAPAAGAPSAEQRLRQQLAELQARLAALPQPTP